MLEVTVLALLQGVAEFLPISSSGHLSILQNFFSFSDVEHDHLFFDLLQYFIIARSHNSNTGISGIRSNTGCNTLNIVTTS